MCIYIFGIIIHAEAGLCVYIMKDGFTHTQKEDVLHAGTCRVVYVVSRTV